MPIRTFIMSLLCLIFSFVSEAQKKAVTEDGDEVILYNDGTWKYSSTSNDSVLIKVNPLEFKKSTNATFLLKSKNTNLGFWIDPKKWSFGKSVDNSDAEFELSLKGKSLVAYILTEEGEIPLESFKNIALINGRKGSPDLHIVNQEYRTVNGLRVLFLQMEGTAEGVKFTFLAYYYSSPGSVVQYFVTLYSSVKNKFFKEAEELLNGLVEINSSIQDKQRNDSTISNISNFLPQGYLSENNNCKLFFEGKWYYELKNDKIDVIRTFDKTTEYSDNKKYFYEYDVEWINNCEYDLIFKRTNKPNYNLINPGEKIHVEIVSIDKNTMQYKGTFRGHDVTGEMSRSN